jgi:biopolymer transport protein ExbD
MKLRPRQTPEIPLTSTADVAFLLLVFFLVAASSGTDAGRNLDLPSTEQAQEQKQEQQNLEVTVKPDVFVVADREIEQLDELAAAIRDFLADKTTPEERLVLITSDDSVTYQRWSDAVSAIEQAGGIPAPQIEESSGESQAPDDK